jgi:poly(3-hydroxybutyrate) depolymerase
MTGSLNWFSRLMSVLVILVLSLGARAEPLPALELDPTGTTVSGLSSGAYMAGQMHVAFSGAIGGAALVAGGPYFCAEGQVVLALQRCMSTLLGTPDVEALFALAQQHAASGAVDPLSNLADDRVYLFSGSEDTTVTRSVMDAAWAFYAMAGLAAPNVLYRTEVPAGHAFLVEGAENSCGATASPFLNDCGIDMAGEILRQFYGELAAPAEADLSRLLTFDQSEFLPDPTSHGMAGIGFVYIPEACEQRGACRLHIAFAGCKQTPDHIGDLYARTAGFNRWAERNRLVILYPQSSVSSGNPNGCWDWWGYDDLRYYTMFGRQTATVAAMSARLGVALHREDQPHLPSSFCRMTDEFNWQHWLENRAAFCGFFGVCAVGSGEALGPPYASTRLYESPGGVYSTTPCN